MGKGIRGKGLKVRDKGKEERVNWEIRIHKMG